MNNGSNQGAGLNWGSSPNHMWSHSKISLDKTWEPWLYTLTSSATVRAHISQLNFYYPCWIVSCFFCLVYPSLCGEKCAGYIRETISWYYIIRPCLRQPYVCPVLATVASLKGRGEQWAEPLVQLATELLGAAKIYTLHLEKPCIFRLCLPYDRWIDI